MDYRREKGGRLIAVNINKGGGIRYDILDGRLGSYEADVKGRLEKSVEIWCKESGPSGEAHYWLRTDFDNSVSQPAWVEVVFDAKAAKKTVEAAKLIGKHAFCSVSFDVYVGEREDDSAVWGKAVVSPGRLHVDGFAGLSRRWWTGPFSLEELAAMFGLETEDPYLASGGNICPECGGGDIESGEGGADGLECWRDVVCHACGAEWQDVYRLVGYATEGVRR